MREAASTGRITLAGNPSSLRNYCCVIDLAQGLLRIAARGVAGRAYNIGSDEHLTATELAQAMALLAATIEVAEPAEAGLASYQRLALDRAKEELSYAPKLRIADVLPAVVAELQS